MIHCRASFSSPGHSYGGAIIKEAAGKCPNMAGLVYIAAIAPEAGESLTTMAQHAKPLSHGSDVKPDRYGRLWNDKDKFHEDYCADAIEEDAQVMAILKKPLAARWFTDTMTNACRYPICYSGRCPSPTGITIPQPIPGSASGYQIHPYPSNKTGALL